MIADSNLEGVPQMRHAFNGLRMQIVSAEIIALLKRGELLIFPTETLYGLGCLATHEDAVRRVFELKGRASHGEAHKPPPVLIGNEAQLSQLVEEVPPFARELMARFWPGALTLVLPARLEVCDLLRGINEAGIATVGVRWTSHPIAHSLCVQAAAPIVATSANFSGATGREAAPQCVLDIPERLRAQVTVLDAGAVAGVPSTVVDCSGQAPKVLRQGAISIF